MKILILAISGGVDSMVLLDMMARQHRSDSLVVAHVNHGIRVDSDEDERLVREAAERYGLDFQTTRLNLGRAASEDLARQHRYKWLNQLRGRFNADALVMAHHQDDVIETMMINMLRGTGWRGLVSLRTHANLLRPLIDKSKAELVDYAINNDLTWRDDSTNDDPRYLRNYIRLCITPALDWQQRQKLSDLYQSQLSLLNQIDNEISQLLPTMQGDSGLSRYQLIMSSPLVGYEISRAWLGRSLTKRQGERLRHFAATARVGALIELEAGCRLQATADQLVVYQPYIR